MRSFCATLYFYASRPILELPEHCTPAGGGGVHCTICLLDVLKGKFTALEYNVNLWADLEGELIFEDVYMCSKIEKNEMGWACGAYG